MTTGADSVTYTSAGYGVLPSIPPTAAGRDLIGMPGNAISITDPNLSTIGVFDGKEAYFLITFLTSGAGALTVTRPTYTATIAKGDTILSLASASPAFYMTPFSVGQKIAIAGAGPNGGVLYSTVNSLGSANSPVFTSITLNDKAQTALSSAANTLVMSPYFEATDVGKTIWISQGGTAGYGVTSATGLFGANNPYIGTIQSVTDYATITLAAAATTNINGLGVRVVWGTDNTNAIVAARNATAQTGENQYWFDQGGGTQALCCAFNLLGSAAALDAQANAIWLGDNVRGFFTDSSGNLLRKYIIPVERMGAVPPRQAKRLSARQHLPRFTAATSPAVALWGDSMATDAPTQSPSWSQATRAMARIREENPQKTAVTEQTNWGIGGAIWQQMAGVFNIGFALLPPFYVANSTALWASFPKAANPDTVFLMENGGNDRQYVYGPAMASVVYDIRTNWTKDGSSRAPDVVMCNGRPWPVSGSNGLPAFADQEGIEKSGMLHRSFARKSGYGFLDYGDAGYLAMLGWSPMRLVPANVMPLSTGITSTPTAPVSIGQKVRDFDISIFLGNGSQSGVTVWTAISTLQWQIGNHPQNVVKFGLDASSNLTMTGITWGCSGTATASITSGAATLALAAATTLGSLTVVSCTPDPTGGTKIVTSGNNWPAGVVGQMLIIPNAQTSTSGSPTGMSDFRTQILSRPDTNTLVVADTLPLGTKPFAAWGATWTYAPVLFHPFDASGNADITIAGAGAAGATLVTKVLTYTDSTHVTLAANAGTTLASASSSIFVGRICIPTFSTTIAAGTALANAPYLQVAVRADELEVSYAPYRATYTITTNCTITSGAAILTTSTNAFEAGMVGQAILVPGAGAAGGTLSSYIKTFTSATQVTLMDNAGTSLAASSKALSIGVISTSGGGQQYYPIVYRGAVERFGGQFYPLIACGASLSVAFIGTGTGRGGVYVGQPMLYMPQGTEMQLWGTSDGYFPNGGLGGTHSNGLQALLDDDQVLDAQDWVAV